MITGGILTFHLLAVVVIVNQTLYTS